MAQQQSGGRGQVALSARLVRDVARVLTARLGGEEKPPSRSEFVLSVTPAVSLADPSVPLWRLIKYLRDLRHLERDGIGPPGFCPRPGRIWVIWRPPSVRDPRIVMRHAAIEETTRRIGWRHMEEQVQAGRRVMVSLEGLPAPVYMHLHVRRTRPYAAGEAADWTGDAGYKQFFCFSICILFVMQSFLLHNGCFSLKNGNVCFQTVDPVSDEGGIWQGEAMSARLVRKVVKVLTDRLHGEERPPARSDFLVHDGRGPRSLADVFLTIGQLIQHRTILLAMETVRVSLSTGEPQRIKMTANWRCIEYENLLSEEAWGIDLHARRVAARWRNIEETGRRIRWKEREEQALEGRRLLVALGGLPAPVLAHLHVRRTRTYAAGTVPDRRGLSA
jgi:hypothetical protein